jgi:hypothetical protein
VSSRGNRTIARGARRPLERAWRSWCGANRRLTPAWGRDSAELGADGCARPRAPAGGTIDDAQQRSDWQIDACGQPREQVFPAPLVHPDLAAAAALAAADQDRPAPVIEVVLGERTRLLDAQSGRPKHHDHRSQPPPVPVVGGASPRRSHRRWAGQPDSGCPCCAAGGPRDTRAWSPANGAARLHRALTRWSREPPPNGQQVRAPPYQAGQVWATALPNEPSVSAVENSPVGTIEPRLGRERVGRSRYARAFTGGAPLG